MLSMMKMEQSMSRRRNCWYNAPIERFVRSLKYEHLHYKVLSDKATAKITILDYLAFYNGQRAHLKYGYLSLIVFETAFYQNRSI